MCFGVQVLCADMVERFQISVYLLLVTGQNWAKDVSQNGHVSTQVSAPCPVLLLTQSTLQPSPGEKITSDQIR